MTSIKQVVPASSSRSSGEQSQLSNSFFILSRNFWPLNPLKMVSSFIRATAIAESSEGVVKLTILIEFGKGSSPFSSISFFFKSDGYFIEKPYCLFSYERIFVDCDVVVVCF